jgi:hypothetical protein
MLLNKWTRFGEPQQSRIKSIAIDKCAGLPAGEFVYGGS